MWLCVWAHPSVVKTPKNIQKGSLDPCEEFQGYFDRVCVCSPHPPRLWEKSVSLHIDPYHFCCGFSHLSSCWGERSGCIDGLFRWATPNDEMLNITETSPCSIHVSQPFSTYVILLRVTGLCPCRGLCSRTVPLIFTAEKGVLSYCRKIGLTPALNVGF